MYNLKNIIQINEIDEKVALIGEVADVIGNGKIEFKDKTGSILVSAQDEDLIKSNYYIILGTSKLTPKGIVIFAEIVVKLDFENNKDYMELLRCFEDKIINKIK